ncbi:MAG: hypothetical protein AAGC70_14715 [Pseudomonadota bacterium]
MSSSSKSGGFVLGFMTVLMTVVGFVVLLICELIAAMLVYGYLNLAHTNLFGWLVRQSRSVLDVVAYGIEGFFPSSANQVYATVFGELGPKSILLLLTGLVVGAFFRLIVWAIVRAIRGRGHHAA